MGHVDKRTLVVGGLNVEVQRRSGQRSMRLHVKSDGRVLVTAPSRMPLREITAFVASRMDWVREKLQVVEAHGRELGGEPTEAELKVWRARIKQYAPGLIAHWAPIMGVAPGKVTYRNMVSRWGSCNVKTGHITLNVQLANHPPECMEYVVVHELCHLLEPSHNARFKALMTHFLPDWRAREKALRGGIRQ